MGMDVSGKNPSSAVGEYFRANVWSWRVIHHLISIANETKRGTLVPREIIKGMSHNDGNGLSDQNYCDGLADALEELIANPENLKGIGLLIEDNDISFPSNVCPVLKSGQFVRDEDLYKYKTEDLRSAYSTDFDHVKEFIEFLRSCGGFEVW